MHLEPQITRNARIFQSQDLLFKAGRIPNLKVRLTGAWVFSPMPLSVSICAIRGKFRQEDPARQVIPIPRSDHVVRLGEPARVGRLFGPGAFGAGDHRREIRRVPDTVARFVVFIRTRPVDLPPLASPTEDAVAEATD